VLVVGLLALAGLAGCGHGHQGLDQVDGADAGTFASTLFPAGEQYPAKAGGRAVVRDCGFSAPLANGRSLWVFCDTLVFDHIVGQAPKLRANTVFIPSATAALATTPATPTPARPLFLHEAAYPAADPQFLSSSNTYGHGRRIRCLGGKSALAWTASLVALPGQDTVLDFYQDHCSDVSKGFPAYDIGVAEISGAGLRTSDLQVTARRPSVLRNPHPGSSDDWGFANGAVIDGRYLYLFSAQPADYSCDHGKDCKLRGPGHVQVARVPWADHQYRSSANYEYYRGGASPWSREPSLAIDVVQGFPWPAGDGVSVGWYPQIHRYVMVHAMAPLAGTGMALRTAPTPWGPWSAAIDVLPQAQSSAANPHGGCDPPTTCRGFALHPELTGHSLDLFFSYIRNGDIVDAKGRAIELGGGPPWRIRLGSVPLSALPR
jgi:hypothetical protein